MVINLQLFCICHKAYCFLKSMELLDAFQDNSCGIGKQPFKVDITVNLMSSKLSIMIYTLFPISQYKFLSNSGYNSLHFLDSIYTRITSPMIQSMSTMIVRFVLYVLLFSFYRCNKVVAIDVLIYILCDPKSFMS